MAFRRPASRVSHLFKAYSSTLASSELLSDFCGCRTLAGIKWTSKSTLQRASTFFSDEQLRSLNTLLVQSAGHSQRCGFLEMEKAADLSACLIDSTCLEANIHFPTDWVLLRDVSLTLLKAINIDPLARPAQSHERGSRKAGPRDEQALHRDDARRPQGRLQEAAQRHSQDTIHKNPETKNLLKVRIATLAERR